MRISNKYEALLQKEKLDIMVQVCHLISDFYPIFLMMFILLTARQAKFTKNIGQLFLKLHQ
jgi:hypothetical protein